MCQAFRVGFKPDFGCAVESLYSRSITCGNIVDHSILDKLIKVRTFVLCENIYGVYCCNGSCCCSNNCDHNKYNIQHNIHLIGFIAFYVYRVCYMNSVF